MAGIFYPEIAAELEQAIAMHRSAASTTPARLAKAIIAPHAGWAYAGDLVASAFRAAEGRKISTVVMLGPVHRAREEGIFLSESDSFGTPIGPVKVDLDLCAEIESCGTSFVVNDIPHLEEHSIEVLLPFVKSFFPKASIVPILVGGSSMPLVKSLARSLDVVIAPLLDETLLVVSTNLSDHLAEERAQAHADAFLDYLFRKDGEGLLRAQAEQRISGCGVVPCAALSECAFLAMSRMEVLGRTRSSDRRTEAKPERDVVQYGALAFA